MPDLSRYKIRYYVDSDLLKLSPLREEQVKIYDVTVKLLEELKARLGVDYEVYKYGFSEEELVYREHFASRSRLLNKIHDRTVARALKSGRGNVHLHNLVALVRDGQVVWYHRGWTRDYELWRAKAEEVVREYGLRTVAPPLHLGFLKAVLDDPQHLYRIVNAVEEALGGATVVPTAHEELVLRLVGDLVKQVPSVAILVEVPLGLRLLREVAGGLDEMVVSAYPLRADVVVVHDPVGLRPGIYPCARGHRQVLRLYRLYRARFPTERVEVLEAERLANLQLRGSRAEVIEVKTSAVDEHAIGQLMVYEALLKVDTGIASIEKAIAAPRDTIDAMNPIIRLVVEALRIKLIPL